MEHRCSPVRRLIKALKESHIIEPMIICPKCQAEIKLMGSLEAPIIESDINYYLSQELKPIGLFIDYGQAVAKRELSSAKQIARYYKIKLDTLRIQLYHKFKDGKIKGRNALFLFATLTKYTNFTGIISLGIHAGVSYYDTTEKFIIDMQKMFTSYSDGKIKLDAPFLKWSKPMIYQYCIDNHVPIELTYSCERSDKRPCGLCNSCLDRSKLHVSTMHKV